MIRGIDYIHKALVLHADVYPRNIMVLKDDPKRVVWLDFDRAESYDIAAVTEEPQDLMRVERNYVTEIAEALVSFRTRLILSFYLYWLVQLIRCVQNR
jgi:hypothetical protein